MDKSACVPGRNVAYGGSVSPASHKSPILQIVHDSLCILNLQFDGLVGIVPANRSLPARDDVSFAEASLILVQKLGFFQLRARAFGSRSVANPQIRTYARSRTR